MEIDKALTLEHYTRNKVFDSHEGIVAGCVKPLALSSTERRDKGPLARVPTALRPSRPVQHRVFHQAEKQLTPLPVLRYGFAHRKGHLKNPIHRNHRPNPRAG